MTLEQTLQLALENHQAGRLPQAEQLYRQVLAADPRQPDALHLLGVLAQQSGKLDAAIQLIIRAIAIRPDAVYHTNLGEALRRRKAPGSGSRLPQSHRDRPSFPTAYINLGVILQELQRHEEATHVLQRAIQIDPKSAQAWTNLGNAHGCRRHSRCDRHGSQSRRSAARIFRRPQQSRCGAGETRICSPKPKPNIAEPSSFDPTFAEALNNLGSVIRRQGDLRTAMHWWQKIGRCAIRIWRGALEPGAGGAGAGRI